MRLPGAPGLGIVCGLMPLAQPRLLPALAAPGRVCHPVGPRSGRRAAAPQERSLHSGAPRCRVAPAIAHRLVETVLPAPAPHQVCQHLLVFSAPLCHTERDQLCFWVLRGPSVLLQVLLAMPIIVFLLHKVINPTDFFFVVVFDLKGNCK